MSEGVTSFDRPLDCQDLDRTSTLSSRLSSSKAKALSSRASQSPHSTPITGRSPLLSSERLPKLILSREERFALALIESKIIRLGEREAFWTSLCPHLTHSAGGQPYFDYPPLFRSLCICDPEVKGNPIYLSSSETGFGGPRTLDVGAGRFLNLPDFEEQCRLLTASPGPANTQSFHIELASRLLSASDDNENRYTLVARLDITESVLALARRLLERYGLDNTSTKDGRSTAELVDDTDWRRAGCGVAPPVLDRLVSDFGVRVPITDPDVVEFHMFVEDLTWFHQDAFILSPSHTSWQITHLTVSLMSAKDDVLVGLSPNSSDTLAQLGRGLAGSDRLSCEIRWGIKAVTKHLYCVPLFRRGRSCWLCFLLGSTLPDFWRELKNSAEP